MPGDLVKVVVAALVARGVHAAYPGLLGARPSAAGDDSCLSRGGSWPRTTRSRRSSPPHAAGDRVALPTGGTSGAPRHVVRTTRSWVASFPAAAALCGLGPDSAVWVPGPLTATMNLFAAVHAEAVGAPLVAALDRATHAFLTPAVLDRLLDAGAPTDGLTVVVAGDRLSPAVAARAVGAGAVVHHYYGAAELSFVAWGGHAEDLRAFPGVDVAGPRRGGLRAARRTSAAHRDDGGATGPLRRDADGWATVGDRGALVCTATACSPCVDGRARSPPPGRPSRWPRSRRCSGPRSPARWSWWACRTRGSVRCSRPC